MPRESTSRSNATKARGRPRYDDVLTPAEWQIAQAVRHGMSNRMIATRRGVSLDAVKFHIANIVGKLGLDDRRALRLWAGIPKHSALNSTTQRVTTRFTHQEVRTMNTSAASSQLTAIGQISRNVRDIEQAVKWYGEVLRLPHLYTFGKLAFFDCGGTRLYLNESSSAPTPESILYFKVANIQRSYEEFGKRGIEFTGAPHMIHKHSDGTEEWMAFFNDPEGRPLALMSQVAP